MYKSMIHFLFFIVERLYMRQVLQDKNFEEI